MTEEPKNEETKDVELWVELPCLDVDVSQDGSYYRGMETLEDRVIKKAPELIQQAKASLRTVLKPGDELTFKVSGTLTWEAGLKQFVVASGQQATSFVLELKTTVSDEDLTDAEDP